MPRTNRLDQITDKLRKRVDRLIGTAHTQFKGTNPYRQTPMTDADKINNYMEIKANPQIEQQVRQSFGDDSFNQMELNVQDLIRRNSNG